MSKNIVVTIALILAGVVAFTAWRLTSRTAAVAEQEYGPKQLLAKYEWFKTAAAELDQKASTIAIYEEKLKQMERDYEGKPRGQWPRDEREAYNQSQAELAGMKASYNGLAAEYNAQSSKFNWDLAKTSDQPLRREYLMK